MATTVDVAEKVKIPGRDCADLKSKLRKGEVFRRGVRLATVRRTRLSMNGQASANAAICAQVIFQTSSECLLCRGRIGRRVMHGFLDGLGGFARDLGDLPHQVGAERKHYIRQTCDMGQKGVSVFLDKAAIA
jgi:hypothetical protein